MNKYWIFTLLLINFINRYFLGSIIISHITLVSFFCFGGYFLLDWFMKRYDPSIVQEDDSTSHLETKGDSAKQVFCATERRYKYGKRL